MKGWSPSSRLLHIWIASGVIYTLCCCVTWPCTFRLISGSLKKNGLDSSKKHFGLMSALRRSSKLQVLAALVGLGYSLAFPLHFGLLFHLEMAEDKALHKEGTIRKWRDHVNEPMAIFFGVTYYFFGSIGGFSDLYLNINKLDIFDQTISEVSLFQKRCYCACWCLLIAQAPVWGLLFLMDAPQSLQFSAIAVSYFGWSVVNAVLVFQFASRLRAFCERSRRESMANTHSSVHSNEEDHPMGCSMDKDIQLLRTIIKQSMLSITKIISGFIQGFGLIMYLVISDRVLYAYARIIFVQTGVFLPLCVYLSFDFASKEFDYLCQRMSGLVERHALGG